MGGATAPLGLEPRPPARTAVDSDLCARMLCGNLYIVVVVSDNKARWVRALAVLGAACAARGRGDGRSHLLESCRTRGKFILGAQSIQQHGQFERRTRVCMSWSIPGWSAILPRQGAVGCFPSQLQTAPHVHPILSGWFISIISGSSKSSTRNLHQSQAFGNIVCRFVAYFSLKYAKQFSYINLPRRGSPRPAAPAHRRRQRLRGGENHTEKCLYSRNL